MKKRPAARKKTVARKAAVKKAVARKAPKKRAAPPKKRKTVKPVASRSKPAPLPKPAPVAVLTIPALPPHRPGLHPPLRPAPAYAHMIERAWAHRPPPHKLT